MSNNTSNAQPTEPLTDIIHRLRYSPSGHGKTKLGHDGVLRSFSGDRNVFDAAALSPAQIQEWLQKTKYLDDSTLARFDGVDGTRVAETEWFEPSDDSLRPPEYTPEQRAIRKPELREMNRRTKERWTGSRGRKGGLGVRV
jgi:hypothetical protein